MKHLIITRLLCTCLGLSIVSTASENAPVSVFKIGETKIVNQPDYKEIYKYYREPNAVVTKKGTLIIIAGPHHIEGKNDRAHQDLLVRRSTDHGKTWSEAKMIADEGMQSLLPTCMVYDELKDRVLLIFNIIYNAPKGPKQKTCRQYIMHSDDEGKTWSERREIMPDNKKLTVFGGGHGFQVKHGPNKGRLVIAGGTGAKHLYTSDDHGQTWQINKVPSPGRKEGTTTELADGTLLVSHRSSGFGINLVRSKDGGKTWSEPEVTLPNAWGVCNNSLLTANDKDGKEILLYLAPVGPDNADKFTLEDEANKLKRGVEDSKQRARSNGTLFISYDAGKSWKGLAVAPGWNFGYNALVIMKNGDIGVIFEGSPRHNKNQIKGGKNKTDHNTNALLGIYFINIPLNRLKHAR